jgi:formate dehydrogenase subunit gamma
MFRALIVRLLTLSFVSFAGAQETAPSEPDRTATGGAQTLEDILARQSGANVNNEFRSEVTGDPEGGTGIRNQLGPLGGASDPDLWRALRFGTANITASNDGPAATTLVQDGGMWWLEIRRGPLSQLGVWLLGGTLALLVVFYLVRGRIRIDGDKTGRTLERFKKIERFGHWLVAGSFLVLGLTGLISLFGRKVLIPAFGHKSFSEVAALSKWAHNNISWLFILGLVMIFLMWVVHNLPDRTDINWLLKGGGIFSSGHPPAKKFNAGQKMIFWSVIIFGTSISVTGLALLFPFEINLFGPTFAQMNALGISEMLGFGELNTILAPHEEMQFAQLWHALLGLILTAIILAHIYIGSVGMEGAYDAMGSGQVEEQWAKEHHSIWAEEVLAKKEAEAERTAPAE